MSKNLKCQGNGDIGYSRKIILYHSYESNESIPRGAGLPPRLHFAIWQISDRHGEMQSCNSPKTVSALAIFVILSLYFGFFI